MNYALFQDEVVGVVICDLVEKDQEEEASDAIFPQKFLKLNRFFEDLKKGTDLFETVS